MRTNIIRVMLTVAVAIGSAATSSERTFAGGQNPNGAERARRHVLETSQAALVAN